MDSLYTRLAQQWDVLFPPDSQRITFLGALVDDKRNSGKIIEVGCGTGATSIALAKAGFGVAASDLDPAMVAQAGHSGGFEVETGSSGYFPQAGKVKFSIDDMTGALIKAPPSSSEQVLCLGNTLPHLIGSDDIAGFFLAASKALKEGGTLVIQLLNYPMIVKKGALDLPELKGDNLRFRRRQVYNPKIGLVEFSTEVESGNDITRATHLLRPVDVKEMTASAVQAGLTECGIYQDWIGTAFDGDAPWLVSLWRKGR
jgi:SAM-dependent methyltransferase